MAKAYFEVDYVDTDGREHTAHIQFHRTFGETNTPDDSITFSTWWEDDPNALEPFFDDLQLYGPSRPQVTRRAIDDHPVDSAEYHRVSEATWSAWEGMPSV